MAQVQYVFQYPVRVLSSVELETKLGCKTSKVYRLTRSEGFPAPRKLPTGGRGWLEPEIDAWLLALPAQEGVG